MNTRVSVVVPTYYRNESLRAAIQSALEQEYEPLEVVVVDDSGAEHARPVVEQFDDVRYVPLAENRGAQNARATGVEAAAGEYVQFLDDDDRLLPGKLRRQVEQFQGNDAVGVVYCGLVWEDGPTVLPRAEVQGNVLADALRFDTAPCMMGTMLIARAVLERIDLRRHDHGADDIGLKIDLARAAEFDYVDEVLLERGDSPGSLGTTQAAVDGRFEIIERYADLYAEFPPEVRLHALAETYLVHGQFLLRDRAWSLEALRSFANAVYYTPDRSLPYVGSLVSALLGRPGYDLSRWLYTRFVLGSERRGKRT